MEGTFIVKKNNELLTFFNYDDIPSEFDHLIRFDPEYKAGPHTEEEHEEMSFWNERLQRLLAIERLVQKVKNGNLSRLG